MSKLRFIKFYTILILFTGIGFCGIDSSKMILQVIGYLLITIIALTFVYSIYKFKWKGLPAINKSKDTPEGLFIMFIFFCIVMIIYTQYGMKPYHMIFSIFGVSGLLVCFWIYIKNRQAVK